MQIRTRIRKIHNYTCSYIFMLFNLKPVFLIGNLHACPGKISSCSVQNLILVGLSWMISQLELKNVSLPYMATGILDKSYNTRMWPCKWCRQCILCLEIISYNVICLPVDIIVIIVKCVHFFSWLGHLYDIGTIM